MAISSKGISITELGDMEHMMISTNMCPVDVGRKLVREIVRLREAIKAHNRALRTSPQLVDKRLWEALDK